MAVRSAYWSLVRWAAVVGMGCGCGGSAVSDTPRARSPAATHRAAWLRAGGVPCGLRRLCLIRLSLRGGVGAEAGDNGDGESKRGVRYPRTAEASADEARRNGDNGENAGWDDGARYFHVLTGSATAKDDADVELMDDTRSTVWEPAVFSYVAGCGERRSTRGGGEGLGGDADVQLEREGEAHADAEEEIVERAQDTAAAAATGGEDQETVHLEAGQEQEEKGAAAMAQMWGRDWRLVKSKSNPILGQRYIPRAPTNSEDWAYCHDEELGFSMFLERRCKRVYFIRHAEAYHNIAEREHELGTLYLQERHSGWKYWDAGLTPKGVEQCAKLRREIQDMSTPLDVELVVVSPLTRTLQTARLTVGSVKVAEQRPHFLASDLCRERITNCPADSRRTLSVLATEFPEVDFSHCIQTERDLIWHTHKEDSDLCKQRGLRFLKWLAKRPESRIAVVTHSGFLNRLFSQFGLGIHEDDKQELRRRPANCEMRGLVLCAHRHFSDVPGSEGYEETDGIPSALCRWYPQRFKCMKRACVYNAPSCAGLRGRWFECVADPRVYLARIPATSHPRGLPVELSQTSSPPC